MFHTHGKALMAVVMPFPSYRAESRPAEGRLNILPRKSSVMNDHLVDPSARRRTTPKKPSTPRVRHPPNAFLLFARDERPVICARCPGMTAGEITSILSLLWRSLDPQKKAAYKLEEQRQMSAFGPEPAPQEPQISPAPAPAPHKLSFKSPAELLPDGLELGATRLPVMPLFGLMTKPV
jgi:hypothetical protein